VFRAHIQGPLKVSEAAGGAEKSRPFSLQQLPQLLPGGGGVSQLIPGHLGDKIPPTSCGLALGASALLPEPGKPLRKLQGGHEPLEDGDRLQGCYALKFCL